MHTLYIRPEVVLYNEPGKVLSPLKLKYDILFTIRSQKKENFMTLINQLQSNSTRLFITNYYNDKSTYFE